MQFAYDITRTTAADWEPLNGGSTHTVIGCKTHALKYGGEEWDMNMERNVFRAATGKMAWVIADSERRALLMEKVGESVPDRKAALEALPTVLHEFHNMKPPRGVPHLTPWEALQRRLNERLPAIPDSWEKEWVLKQSETLEPTAKELAGTQMSHGDVHLENLRLVGEGRYCLIDFEWVSQAARPEYDLGTLLYAGAYRKETTFPGYDPVALYPGAVDADLVRLALLYKTVSGVSYRLFFSGVEGARDLCRVVGAANHGYNSLVREAVAGLLGREG